MAKKSTYKHPTRLFSTPGDLLKVWEEYKEDLNIQAGDWVKVHYVGKDGVRVEDPQKPPMSFDGFEVYCYHRYGCIDQYFKNKGGYYEEFIPLCRAIKQEIRVNQINGGMLGFYNPSITQRLNNLVDKQEIQKTKFTVTKRKKGGNQDQE